MTPLRTFETPRESDIGLRRITNTSGLSISVLPNGCVFAIEHRHERGRTLINQVQGSPLDGGIGRLCLRVGGPEAAIVEAVGPGAKVSLGAADDCFTWEGETPRVRHSVSLWLHPQQNLWLWRVQVANVHAQPLACDAILVQDIGLGDRGFVMNNEAFASQYIDHHIARHRALRAGGDEPAESGAERRAPVGRARLPRGCLRLRHRCDAAPGPAVSGRRPDRPRARSAERAAPA